MSGPYVEFAGETDTGRGPSFALWNSAGSVLADLAMGNFNRGFIAWRDDFVDLPTGKYTATQATTGTFALDDAEGGVALADCNSSTVTQGINVQLGGTAGETVKAVANQVIWFEARVKVVDMATGPEFFLGLAVTDTTIIAASALSAQAIGFKSETDNGVLLATCKDGSSETTGVGTTLVDGTYVKLGFKVTGTSKVEFFVNGAIVSTVTANIPTTEMRPSLVCQSDGVTDSILHIDWGHCVVQLSGT